jgi:hypothetical protein
MLYIDKIERFIMDSTQAKDGIPTLPYPNFIPFIGKGCGVVGLHSRGVLEATLCFEAIQQSSLVGKESWENQLIMIFNTTKEAHSSIIFLFEGN